MPTWAPLDPTEIGVGVQVGALRPDMGADDAELKCSNCGAGWVGIPGEPCGWCENNAEPSAEPSDDILVDWTKLWDVDAAADEWLAEPIVPSARSTVIYAPAGVGKSLLALWIAVKLSTGRHPFANHAVVPVDVLYLDYEMSPDDLRERLELMGCGPDTDLSRLHYALQPPSGPLDDDVGGTFVRQLATRLDVALVVIDTMGQAVGGEENDADTYRRFAQRTGRLLKRDGRAVVRIDHAGKNIERGQRGSSAKNDDADVIWKMTKREPSGFRLAATKRRVGWVPAEVELSFEGDDEITFGLDGDAAVYPDGTVEVARVLDDLGVPLEASGNAAQRALRDNDQGRKRALVLAAQKYRRERSPSLYLVGDEQGTKRFRTTASDGSTKSRMKPQVSTPESVPGTDAPVTLGTGGHPVPEPKSTEHATETDTGDPFR